MKREDIIETCNREVLDSAARLFGASREHLTPYADYEGCQNLIYEYRQGGQPMILRISYRPDRTTEQIQAELHFVTYLADHGVRVSRAVPSRNGNLLESIHAGGIRFAAASFVKGKGMRVPDNEYRYREGAPIEEYCQNWGRILGQMHALAKNYQPPSETIRRPDWLEITRYKEIDALVPESLPVVRQRLHALVEQIRTLPRDRESHGLIHGDFNDGNFTVDYDNGDITAFDFDDCGYFWFVYELACAWEGFIGRAMFRPLDERRARMERFFDNVLSGYNRENTLSAVWLERIPLFVKVIEMEEFLHYARYMADADEETRAALDYKIACIENDIPYMGFYDSIYSPERPFSL
jgi:Ser/Thr protein kinase RdoA (MazF antagonist)